MIIMAVTPSFADKKKKLNDDTNRFRYDIEYCKASDGFILVKVWSYSKNAKLALEQARKNAVHGVIFRGFVSTNHDDTSIPALAKDPAIEATHADFFETFFDDETGSYMRYAPSIIESSTQVVKFGKEYKAGVVVTVNRSMLRKHLEEAGIITRFGGGVS